MIDLCNYLLRKVKSNKSEALPPPVRSLQMLQVLQRHVFGGGQYRQKTFLLIRIEFELFNKTEYNKKNSNRNNY